MSLYKNTRELNKRIWTLLTCITIDETEAKEIIDLLLIYGQISRTHCKNQHQYKKLTERIFDDIAIIETKDKEFAGNKIKTLNTKEVLLNDES